MSQSGFTPILLYGSTTTGNAPLAANLTTSASGVELAINAYDGKLFYKDSGGVVQVIATKGTGTIGGSNTQVQYNSSGALAGSSNLTFDGTTLTANALTLTNKLTIANGGTNATATPTAGAVAYGTGSAYAFTSAGTTNQVLVSNGASAPTWSNLSSIGVTTFSAGTTGFTPNSATSGAITLAGTLATTNGGTGLTSFTANGVVYASSTSALTTGSALTFDGTNLTLGGTAVFAKSTVINALSGSSAAFAISDNATTTMYANNVSSGVSALWSSGALAFGTNNGTFSEQMRLTSTGLGIGTSSPSSWNTKLVVYNSQLTVTGGGYDGSFADSIYFGGNSEGTTYRNKISNSLSTTTTNQMMKFSVANGASTWVDVMTLNGAGNVGIGTSSPSYKLDVTRGASSGVVARLGRDSGAAAFIYADSSQIYYGAAAGVPNCLLINEGSNYLTLNTNGNERMRLDSSGNLGLGVTPSAWWSSTKAIQIGAGGVISGRTDTAARNYFASNAFLNSTPAWTYISTNFATRYEQNDGQHQWFTAPSGTAGNAITFTQAMTLTAAGRLGLGLTSPSTLFEAYGGAAGTSSELTVGNASTAARFGVDTSNEVTVATGQAVPIKFLTSNTERARIDSSGNLGLGVTPSGWGGGIRAFQVGSTGSLYNLGGPAVGFNTYNNGANNLYLTSDFASIYSQTSGQHRWFTAPSGTAGNAITFTQAMTLDASGNLGIGTTSPGSYSSKTLQVTGSSTDVAIKLTNTTTGSGSGAGFDFELNGNDINFVNRTASGVQKFWTNSTERARIDSSGNFMVGQTSTNRRFAATHNVANYTAEISNSNGTPYGIYVLYSGAAPNNTGSQFFTAVDTGGTRFDVRSNGGLANYSANDVNLSDRREKTNFAPAGEYLSKICAIPVQTFNYIDQNLEEDDGLTLGVVAQDVQAVAPELVTESNWGTEDEPKMRLSIYQTDLQYALMKCIQEQQALITQLTERITALESK